MKRVQKIDEFFYRQPELKLVDQLREPMHQEALSGFGRRSIESGEVCVNGLYVKPEFEDPEGLLETAYEDLERFGRCYGIAGKRFPVVTRYQETECFEEYMVSVSEQEIVIAAADTEGIRRGIFWLEDELKAREGAFLEKGTIKRTPHIRKRIVRGVFSPTNRPPKNGDELSDEIDYYPEEYLNRLAHDGTNGLWIYTKFSDIIPSEVITEYGQGYEKRIEKLNQVCERCERYGISVYVFAIEPEAPSAPKVIENHKDLLGTVSGFAEFRKLNGIRAFCTHTEKGRKYCIDATKKLCELVPKLGGFISITAGERITSCAAEQGNTCPICGHIPRGENLSQTIDCLREGMRLSGSKAEMISWTYGHRMWEKEDILDYVKSAPDDIMLMQNFDDMGYEEQLGRMRQGVDYWLSYPGPSGLFADTAAAAQKYRKHMYAKMQVCCSHEVATLPYIPVPGIIFDKFKGAHAYGVEGVMESWYFGNYPSIMSKAAGELSFCQDFSDKHAFLERLASIYCGRNQAKALASAWECFEAGYRNYPLNIMFSYYGPMHDGVCWELQLKPKNFSLSRSWLLMDKPDGDRIYEALLNGHTLDEAIILAERMRDSFLHGVTLLENAMIPKEHLNVIRALTILFTSGTNILTFYRMREGLGGCSSTDTAEALALLEQMEELVRKEMQLSADMIPLCEADSRLGYHSEAEGYKFFPEKLEHRIQQLENLLKEEFSEIRERISAGLVPLAYYQGEEEDSVHYKMLRGNIADAPEVRLSDGESTFCAAYDARNLYLKFSGGKKVTVAAEFELMHPYPTIQIEPDGTTHHSYDAKLYNSLFGEAYDAEQRKWKVCVMADGILLTFSREEIGWLQDTPIKLSVKIGQALWCVEEETVYTLGKQTVSPGEFGWLMP